MRGRANIELQSPLPGSGRCRAPQIERADFGEAGMQRDFKRFGGGMFLAGFEHGANRRQPGELQGIDRGKLARLVGQTRIE